MKKCEWLIFLMAMITSMTQAQGDENRIKHFNTKKSLAISGYDPVSYFDHHPSEGSENISIVYKGIQYRFTNESNRARFKSNPEKYEPAYGGWCAYAMGATGEQVKIDPETYKIVDGRLFLFYNFWANNTLTDWNKNEKPLMEKADRNWKKIVP